MDGSAYTPRFAALFAEDFDLPRATPQAQVIEPVFSASELTAAREAAWQEGHAAGLREAAETDTAATKQAIAQISELLRSESQAGLVRAETEAAAIAQLLLDSLAAVFPTLAARYGDAEVRAIIRTVLPALIREPVITVRAHPETTAVIAQEIVGLDPDLKEHVQTISCEDMMPGDLRIAWRNGSAVRNATALWQQIAEILTPAGLLRTDTGAKERADGE
jgi:flagellar assembly protein FliH